MAVVVRVKVVTDDKQFKKLVASMKKSLADVGKSAKGLGPKLSDPPKRATPHWKNASTAVAGFGTEFKRLMGMGASLVILQRAAKALMGFAVTADRTRISLVALNQVGKTLGATQDDVKGAIQAVTKDGLVPMNVGLQNLQDLMRSGLGLQESIVLMDRLKDLAAINRSVHIGFTDAVLNLTQAFKTEQSRLGDLSGLTENFATNIIPVGIRVMNEMGHSIDKDTIALDNNMRALVKYHGIMKLTNELQGGHKIMLEGITGALAAMEAQLLNTKIALGANVPFFDNLITGATRWLKFAETQSKGAAGATIAEMEAAAKEMAMAEAGSARGRRLPDFLPDARDFEAWATEMKTKGAAAIADANQELARVTNASALGKISDKRYELEVEVLSRQKEIWKEFLDSKISYVEAL